MILVRTEFQCKFGRVQEAIDSFKAMAECMDSQNVIKRSRIMTDLSGRFDTVVVESEVESIDAYFARLHAALQTRIFKPGKQPPLIPPTKRGSAISTPSKRPMRQQISSHQTFCCLL